MKKEEIVKFYSNYKIFIYPTVTAIVGLLLLVLVIYPQSMQLLSNQKAQQEISARSDFLEAKAKHLGTYDQADLSNQVNLSLSSFPADKDFASVIGLLQNLTAQAGFNIISLSLGSSGGQNRNVQSYSIKLDLIGPLSFSSTLLKAIENSPRLIKISGIEVSAGKDLNSAAISLNLDVLYSAAMSSYGTVDSPLPELSEQDREVLATLQSSISSLVEPQATSGASIRGKVNPFE